MKKIYLLARKGAGATLVLDPTGGGLATKLAGQVLPAIERVILSSNK